MIDIVILIIGLVGLFVGADFLIKGAKNVADHFGIPHLIIGLTIVSIGTSIPEIAVSVAGALDRLKGIETSGIVIGNQIGSVLSQISLLLGIVAFTMPLHIKRSELMKQGSFLLGATLLAYGLSADGYLTRMDGVLLVLVYIFYHLALWKDNKIQKRETTEEIKLWQDISFIIFGTVLTWFMSDLVIHKGLTISETLGVSQSLVGILILGVGTGLPELSVAITSFRKGIMSVSMGTLIGSNICDILFSMGIGTIVSGFIVEEVNVYYDYPALIILTGMALLLLGHKGQLSRPKGALLIGAFVTYAIIKIVYVG